MYFGAWDTGANDYIWHRTKHTNMEKYKGLEIAVNVDRGDLDDGEDKGAIERSLCASIVAYLNAFETIPGPYLIADTHGSKSMSDCYLNFQCKDGDLWVIKWVCISASRITFEMVYGV